MSPSVRPVAYSMAWDAPWALGWVIRAEYLLRPGGLPSAMAWRGGPSATEGAAAPVAARGGVIRRLLAGAGRVGRGVEDDRAVAASMARCGGTGQEK